MLRVLLYSIFFMFVPRNKENIIFTSYSNKKYNFYSRLLFEYYLCNNSRKERVVKFVIDDDKERYYLISVYGDHFITSKTHSGLCFILSSYTWVTSTRPIFINIFAMFNRFNVNVWHGIPIKKICLLDKLQPWYKKIIYEFYYSNLFYDMFVTTSKESTRLICQSFGIKKSKCFIGGSIAGEMFGNNIDKIMDDKFKLFLNEGRKNKILYAPTYRDFSETVYFPFDDIDIDDFECFLELNDMTIYIKPHHLDNGYKDFINLKGVEYIGSDILNEINLYLNEFSILVTDYSSIIFDYLLTDGKVIFIPYDYNEFSSKRGFNYTMDDICCGPSVYSYKDLKSSLINSLNNDSYYRDEKVIILDKFHDIKKNQCELIMSEIDRRIV